MDLYWIWLANLKGIGTITARKLIEIFESPYEIYNAAEEELKSIEGIKKSVIDKIIVCKSLIATEKIMEKCTKHNIKLLAYDDPLYPSQVKSLKKSPVLLYYKGNIIKSSIGVGIVGSRRCTQYGKQVAVEAAEFLSSNNIPVISGMAKGIDSYAHTARLNKDGYTIAFLGNSVDICYPKEHERLMDKIIEKGAVVSQYPPSTMPSNYNFPERNYLLSAWCNKLLVVEAAETSGALITAKFAKEQGREVYAVPNNIYCKESVGTNKLIESGSKIYLNPSQLSVGEGNNYVKANTSVRNSDIKVLNQLEQKIVNMIEKEPKTPEEIFILLKENKDVVIRTLLTMEIEGKIESLTGGKYGIL